MDAAVAASSYHAADMTIRTATLADQDAYRDFFLRGVMEHPSRFRIDAADFRLVTFPTQPTEDRTTLVACHDSGTWMGVASVERELGRVKRRHIAWLNRMYVASEFAGSGVGGALVGRCVEAAKSMSEIRQLNLTVVSGNERAIRLYERHGFVRFSREPRAILQADGTFLDEDEMQLLLPC
jgi:GNAT superfamily N-acetyltransferase